jgi:hypothetical protein
MEEEDGRNGEETCTVCQPVDFDFPQIIKSPQNQQRTNTNQLFWLLRKRRLDHGSLTKATPALLHRKISYNREKWQVLFHGKTHGLERA